jgi:hypothetical protein
MQGGRNREQIEKVFYRAFADADAECYTSNARAATIQSARDLCAQEVPPSAQ